MTPIRTALAITALTSLMAATAFASSPKAWHFFDGRDFAQGKLDGIALHETDGLSVAPSLERLAVDAEFIHCWVRDGSTLWLGTGLGGGIFTVKQGKVAEVARLKSTMIGALAADGDGGVYAGLVGSGEIARVGASGKVETLVKLPDTRHIWALLKKGNTLFAGTGPGGKVFAVDLATKAARVYAETDTDHVLVLLEDKGALLAGTSGDAMLIRIEAENKARAIAAFPGGEVRGVARLGDKLYAAVNGGQSTAALGQARSTPERPGTDKKKAPTKATAKKGKRTASKGKGAVFSISDDGRIQSLFASPEGMLSELGAAGQGIVAGAARGGRVLVADLDGSVQTLFDLDEEQVLGVEMGPKGPRTLFTGKGGAIYLVGAPRKDAVFTSQVLQENGVAQWGRLEAKTHGDVLIETRSGFSNPANDTWSPWVPLKNERIQSPASTHLQVRARFNTPDAHLYELRVFRRLFNRAPLITKLLVKPDPKTKLQRVEFAAVDPDGDAVQWVVSYRLRGTPQWLMLHDRTFPKTTMTLSPRDMPDGWYEVRVVATDAEANAAGEGRETSKISKPFLVDQGRPEVTGEVREGVLSGVASDRVSNIEKVAVSFDGEPPLLAGAGDGIFDGLQEAFELKLPKEMLKGRHTLLIQASDEAGNTGVLRLTIGR